MKTKTLFLLLLSISSISCFGQTNKIDSIKIDYKKLYSFCLDGEINSALSHLEFDTTKKVSLIDSKFKTAFENRFKFEVDKSNYLIEKKSSIDDLLLIFRNYWRKSLLGNKSNYDESFIAEYQNFIKEKFPNLSNKQIKEDSTDMFLRNYLNSRNLFTTDGIGKTGKLYDLLVWKTQKDTTYTFKIFNEKISVNVVMMSDFITLGWEEYATFNRYYPGGWATDKSLYCVAKAYDLNSEDFLVSYLAHEGRHFKDYKLFPKLKNSADLEYRAKLTELSLAKKTLYDLLEFFISNANYESESGHQIANYCAIRDLSKELFKVDFEKNIDKWKLLKSEQINKAAYKILNTNTKLLSKNAKNIENFIK